MNVFWTPVFGSSAIRAIGAECLGEGGECGGSAPDPADKIRLHVKFLGGHTYVYDVPDASYYFAFLDSASKGRFYVFIVKARFDYVVKY